MIALLTIPLTLAATRLTPGCAAAKAAGPALLITPLFFRGHFVGRGSLARLWPLGIVLQRMAARSFTESPALVMFAGQTDFLGWPEHEKLWRGHRADVARRDDEVGLPAGASVRIQPRIGSRRAS